MRRKDREVTDAAKIEDIIRQCSCCRIGFCDDGEVYIVPLNFGYEIVNDIYIFYFHGAKEGRKIELIRKNPHVGFEMDTDAAVYKKGESDLACTYTARFQSVIGNGIVQTVSETEEKRHGLALLMAHSTGKSDFTFDEKAVETVSVFRLTVMKLSCKEHL